MSKQFPPSRFVKHHDPKLSSANIIKTSVEGVGQNLQQDCNRSVAHDAPSVLLRDNHIVLLAIDALLALHASFKKWRQRRRTLRALADLDESQLRDIGLTRDEALFEASPKWPRCHRSYSALAELDDTQLSNLSELGLQRRREVRRINQLPSLK